MSDVYGETVRHIQAASKNLTGPFAFLVNYRYDLKSDQLTDFGRQEMMNAGIAFYQRYQSLTAQERPFIRASGQDRVVESAENFLNGFYAAGGTKSNPVATSERRAPITMSDRFEAVQDILVVPEGPGSNNTLSHGLCPAFEAHHYHSLLTPLKPIATRINANVPGANLTLGQVSALMDLCPFSTIASPDPSALSPFCHLFTDAEWRIYDAEKSSSKYFSYGAGSSFGPSQGLGWVNELIARLTNQAVEDHTSVNHTLDSNPTTFPLGRTLYADFSHDNTITSILFALGLYMGSPSASRSPPSARLSKGDKPDLAGFKASETVPFAGRAAVEKMICSGEKEEMVRVVVNGRVMPLLQCHDDELGRCTLSQFIASLGFARKGGRWEECFEP
ncbi:MAG: hypothetical protein Q9191_007994 [Dirinaria sp. TL-2023a]